MSRRKALIYHLGGTLLLLALVTAFVYIVWFPSPFGQGLGAWRQVLMLWLLPLGAGPLLTFVLFKPGKPGLKFDIAFIAVAQVLALALSLGMTYQARPVFVVFAVDRFEVVQPGGVVFDGVEDPVFAAYPMAGPVYVVAEMPTDTKERSDLLFSSLDGTGDVQNFARYYRPYGPPYIDAVLARAEPLSRLLGRDAATREAVVAHLAGAAGMDRLLYAPVMMRASVMTAVVDATDGRVIDVLPVAPN